MDYDVFEPLGLQELSACIARAAETQHPQHARLEALYQLSLGILREPRDLPSLFDQALRDCLTLTESAFGFIGLNNDNRSAMDVVAIQGFKPAPHFFSRYHLIPLRPTILSQAAQEALPVRSDDVRTDPRRVGQPPGHPPVETFLGVPLRVIGKPIGMIGVANRANPYGEEEEQILLSYAAHVALAIYIRGPDKELTLAKEDLEGEAERRTAELTTAGEELAHRAERLQQLLHRMLAIQEEERGRIARDIHDGVSQLIVGAMFELRAARERLRAADQDGAERAMGQVRAILGQVDDELRRIIFDLRPPMLDTLGLAGSIERYVEQFRARTGINCTVEIRGQPARVPAEIEIGVYRIMQEALNNVAQHAHTRTARVVLDIRPDAVELTVADDGRGFDRQVVEREDQVGLAGMEERATRLGGRLIVESRSGSGCTVTLRIPLGASFEDA